MSAFKCALIFIIILASARCRPTHHHPNASILVNHQLFSAIDIDDIWKKMQVTDAYLDKWKDSEHAIAEVLRLFKYDSKSHDYPRIPILLDFYDWVQKHNLTSPDRLMITSQDPELRILKPKNIATYVYNQSTGDFDLHLLGRDFEKSRRNKIDLLSEESKCDLVIISQTFEHLYDPFLVAHNIYKILRPGGYVFTSAPALNIQHMTPYHFFHYTPMGMVMLFESANMHVVELGQWGNIYYENLLLKNKLWPDVYQIRKSIGSNMIENQRSNPDHVWVLAQKPLNNNMHSS